MVHNHPTMTRSSDGSNVKRDQGLAERQVDGGGGDREQHRTQHCLKAGSSSYLTFPAYW